MLSILYYLFLSLLCTFFIIVSALTLAVTWPFDKARKAVHTLSRWLVRIFFAIPPRWKMRVIGGENADPAKTYVIVLNHQTVLDIPSLYLLPLNFRWVSKREVFKVPFFGQLLWLHGDICINRGRAAEAMNQLLREGSMWLRRGASVAIFPEGTRSRDGAINRFKAGAFTLAKETGTAILPVVVEGSTTFIKPRTMLFNWRNRLTLRVLPAVPAERVAAEDPKTVMEEVREAMIAAQQEVRAESRNV